MNQIALPNRDLARLAITSLEWSADKIGNTYPSHVIKDTADELDAALKRQLSDHEPKLDGSLTKPVRDVMTTIGTTLFPTAAPEVASAWVEAVIDKLSNVPPYVLRKATERAKGIPFKFSGDVEEKIRELVDEETEEIKRSVHRLREAEAVASGNDFPRNDREYSKALFRFHQEHERRRDRAHTMEDKTDLAAWVRGQQLKMRDPLFVRIAPCSLDAYAVQSGIREGWLENRHGQLWEIWTDARRELHKTPLDPVDFPLEGYDYTIPISASPAKQFADAHMTDDARHNSRRNQDG